MLVSWEVVRHTLGGVGPSATLSLGGVLAAPLRPLDVHHPGLGRASLASGQVGHTGSRFSAKAATPSAASGVDVAIERMACNSGSACVDVWSSAR